MFSLLAHTHSTLAGTTAFQETTARPANLDRDHLARPDSHGMDDLRLI
jgi:hypothetical protein